ncbi:MAG: hypothetical protein ABJA67_02190 [Chthonomonadales bacterium]
MSGSTGTGNAVPQGVPVSNAGGQLTVNPTSTYSTTSPGSLTIRFTVNDEASPAFQIQNTNGDNLTSAPVSSYTFNPTVNDAVAKTTSDTFVLVQNQALGASTTVMIYLKGTLQTEVESSLTV